MSALYDFGSAEFDEAVRAAGRQAFEEALAAGLPVRRELRNHPRTDGARRVRQRAVSQPPDGKETKD
jgi:hypothetical protein